MPMGLLSTDQARRVKRPAPSKAREMRVRIPPWERSLRAAASSFWSPRSRPFQSRRMPAGLHGVAGSIPALRKQVAQLDRAQTVLHQFVAVTNTNIMANADLDYMLFTPQTRVRVPPHLRMRSLAARTGSVRSNPRRHDRLSRWRMPMGVHGEGRKARGSNPRSHHPSSPAQDQSAANAGGTTSGTEVRLLPGFQRPEMSRHSVVAAPRPQR